MRDCLTCSSAPARGRARKESGGQHEQREAARQETRSGMRLLRRGRGGGSEIRGHRENAMGSLLQRHGTRAASGGYGGDNAERGRAVLVNHGDAAVAVGREGQSGGGI